MTITATIIADSVSPDGIRLTTLQLRYPKFIHGEFMTHRVFSRNASSSRAVPVERMIEDVIRDPAMPSFWGRNRPGMSAAEECNEDVDIAPAGNTILDGRCYRETAWLKARDEAVFFARRFHATGYHKQIVNRLIEPWCHINVVVTSTEWANFDALRCHPYAQPEMRALAEAMRDARAASAPKLLRPGKWHVPYVNEETDDVHGLRSTYGDGAWTMLIKLSVARCARVSYLTHEGKPPDVEEDLRLYERLVGSVPLHASPAEHQATPDERRAGPLFFDWKNPEQHGNFVGWRQFRKTLPNESARDR